MSKRTKSKVTLKLIADAAGTSKFTVSRALAKKSGVSESTRERIIELADKMGYRRQTMQSGRTLAVLCEDEDLINGELNQKILSGIRDEVYRNDLDLIELQTSGARRLSDVAERIDALIVISINRLEVENAAVEMGLPIIKIGTFEPLEQADIVRGTNYETGRVVGDLFLKNGHNHLVYVRGRRDFRGRQERYNGFVTANLPDEKAKVTDLRWKDGKDLSSKLNRLLSGRKPATAFFCAHDGLAVTIMSELLSRNLRIPLDASVVGYGNYMSSQHVRPLLTTVDVPGAAFGREAVRLAKMRMDNPGSDQHPIRIQIPSEIIYRDTVGKFRD
ncbi:MAG: LacI family transcriptional regulator [Gammaproteobacteria bacterium]|nr:LacI family transcriptional regulator [Gammaproteobacteria bacterium]